MQTNSTPRTTETPRPRLDTQPEPKKRDESDSVKPEPHWELIIDAATD